MSTLKHRGDLHLLKRLLALPNYAKLLSLLGHGASTVSKIAIARIDAAIFQYTLPRSPLR